MLPIPESYTFLHRLLTRNPLTSYSWPFLHFPELQTSHPWLSDHFSSWNECKAEFRNLCISGITRKCRNFWSFLPIPESQISHGWLSDPLQSLNKCKAEFRNFCISGITRKCRNSWSFLTIPESQISHPHILAVTDTLTLTPHPHPHILTLTSSPSNW